MKEKIIYISNFDFKWNLNLNSSINIIYLFIWVQVQVSNFNQHNNKSYAKNNHYYSKCADIFIIKILCTVIRICTVVYDLTINSLISIVINMKSGIKI